MEPWLVECVQCGSDSLKRVRTTERRVVAGVEFATELEALRCARCGETYVSDAALAKRDVAIAAELGRLGRAEPEAFRFMRKALDLRGVDLAQLLDVTPDTVSRWERGAVDLDHVAFAVLGALASEAQRGSTEMLERLRATHDGGRTPAKPVKVVVSAA